MKLKSIFGVLIVFLAFFSINGEILTELVEEQISSPNDLIKSIFKDPEYLALSDYDKYIVLDTVYQMLFGKLRQLANKHRKISMRSLARINLNQ